MCVCAVSEYQVLPINLQSSINSNPFHIDTTPEHRKVLFCYFSTTL